MSKKGKVIFDDTFGVLLQAVPRKNGCEDCFFDEVPNFCKPCSLNDNGSEDIIYRMIPKSINGYYQLETPTDDFDRDRFRPVVVDCNRLALLLADKEEEQMNVNFEEEIENMENVIEDKPFIPFDPKQAMYGAPLRLDDPRMEVTFASAELTEDTGCLKKICVLIKDKDNRNYCGFFCYFDENGKDLSEGNRQLFMDDSECGTRRLPFSLETYNKETDEILDLEGNRITILDIINDKRLPVVAKKTYPDGSEEVETYTLDGHTTSCQTYIEITSTNLVIRRQDQSFDMNRILNGYPATTLEGYPVEPVRYLKDDKLLVARIKKGNEIRETTFDKDGKALKGNLYGYDLELKMKPAKDYYLIPFDYNIFSGKGIKAVTRNGKEVIYVNIKDNGTGPKTITAQVRDFEGKTKTISLTKKKDDNSFFNELLLKVPVSK